MGKTIKETKEVDTPKEEVKEKPFTPRQVFVSGIPYSCTEDDLKAFFKEEAEHITEIKMPKFQDSGRCIGYAHVMINSKDAFQAALGKNKQTLQGRWIEVKEAEGSKDNPKDFIDQAQGSAEMMPSDCTTLFVKNLPYTLKEDDIGDRFRRFGTIKAIRIAYNWQTKMSKGFAYIDFETHEGAKNALLKMNGREVQGRCMRIDFDTKSAKMSYHVNLDQDKNKLYNKEVIKNEKSKAIKKERDRAKDAKLRNMHRY